MSDPSDSLHSGRVLTAASNPPADGEHPHGRIQDSWSRCLEQYGLDPEAIGEAAVLEHARMRECQERLGEFLEFARVASEDIYHRTLGSGFSVLLTDHNGVIVHYVGDPSLRNMFQRAGLWLGAVWDEENQGTNGIGTCIAEGRPVMVHRDEHFHTRNTGLTCSGAPIHDPHGNLLAVLDASSVDARGSRETQYGTMGLVRMAANTVEHCEFLRHFRDGWVLHFSSQPEFVGLPNDALIALDEEGKVQAANANALRELGLADRSALVGHLMSEFLDLDMARLRERLMSEPRTVWPVQPRTGGPRLYAMLRAPVTEPVARGPCAGRRKQRSVRREDGSVALGTRSSGDCLSLCNLAGDDPHMAYNVRLAERIMNKRISMLLCGETGTGKEAFARAVHEASERRDRPFVPVNCAAIPESLIESELFGYKHGAFTGARREGMRGKFLQSSGGTLFLDEIGDMPPQLQTRLLRVLEEQEVLPLGCDTPAKVDLNVISATHRNLTELVESGEFREDLYYRLNGITITLPALRERVDKESLVASVMCVEDEDEVVIAPDAFDALLAHSWPGNIRELRNVMRTAHALCDDGIVRLSDLPREIAFPQDAARGQRPHMDEEAEVTPISGNPLESAEREAIIGELEQARWNVTIAAAKLRMSRNTLYRKMRKHGIARTRPA